MKKHFLVVDDSELNLRVVQVLLSKYNIDADFVTSADHAFTALTESEYDLVLMDYLMPVMNGIEAAKHIRNMTDPAKKDYFKNLPIIALTAEENPQLISVMKKSGINDVLNKPIQPEALQRILNQWVPTIKGIDEATLISMLDSDKSSYLELVSIFVSDLDGKQERIADALAAEDYESYTVEVHRIKGECKVIGATALAEAAKMLEFTGKAATGTIPNGKTPEDNIKIIRRDTPKVVKALKQIGKELQALLDENNVCADTAVEEKVNLSLRPELEKLSRYCAHAQEALDENDLTLTREWIGEISEVLGRLLEQ